MKRGRLPLTALRSFEVAGRLMSFSQAADELHVSQAAVSRQIRELEQSIGHRLFLRLHRRVDLTPEGRSLLAVLTRAFDEVDNCLTDIARGATASELRISVEPSFASCWLMPKIGAFQAANPQVDLSIDTDHRLVEFRTGEAELAVRYGATATSWPRTESLRLWTSNAVVVAAPSLLAGRPAIRNSADLAAFTLLHEENRLLWGQWFAAQGETIPAPARGPILTDGGLVLQAVLAGQGVALLDRLFVVEQIAAGRLVQLFDSPFAVGAYFLVTRRFDRLAPPAQRFMAWIKERAEADV